MNLETRTQLETATATHWKDKIFLPPGKSLKQWSNERVSRVPKFLHDKIWQAIFGKNVFALSILLDEAGFGGAERRLSLKALISLPKGRCDEV